VGDMNTDHFIFRIEGDDEEVLSVFVVDQFPCDRGERLRDTDCSSVFGFFMTISPFRAKEKDTIEGVLQ